MIIPLVKKNISISLIGRHHDRVKSGLVLTVHNGNMSRIVVFLFLNYFSEPDIKIII